MEIDVTDTVSIGWLLGAFVLGFVLPLISYLGVFFMIGSDLNRKLCEIISILEFVLINTEQTASLLEVSSKKSSANLLRTNTEKTRGKGCL